MVRLAYPRVFGCPEIEQDEALSGWVVAVAAAARLPVRNLFGCWKYSELDLYQIDVSPWIRPFAAMSSMTLVSPESIQATTRMFRAALSKPEYRCLTRRRNGQPMHRYCPDCLEEDRRPYVRGAWRLCYWTVCERHRSLLLDRCPACHFNIDFSKFFKTAPSLEVGRVAVCCPECTSDLRSAQRLKPPAALVSVLIQAQRRIHRVVLSQIQRLKVGTVSSCHLLDPLLECEVDEKRGSALFVGLNWRRILANYYREIQEMYGGLGLSEME